MESITEEANFCRHFRLIAYRGTGKDTFVTDIQERRCLLSSSSNSPQWMVYTATDKSWRDLCHLCSPYTCSPRLRLAFADFLKEEVHRYLQLPSPSTLPYYFKDSLVIDGMTLREHYRRRAAEIKKECPDFYLLQLETLRESIVKNDPSAFVVVTDQRFPLETPVSYPSVSIRLYREKVPLPSADDDSEHSLDDYVTDLLLVAPGDEDEAFRLFPQYSHHYYCGTVTKK